jgi:c-di-GMP-binding flagellar brake protein YcgR
MAYENIQDILNPSALILPIDTTANITTIAGTAEMGTLMYSTDDAKLIFVKNAAGHEHVTSG